MTACSKLAHDTMLRIFGRDGLNDDALQYLLNLMGHHAKKDANGKRVKPLIRTITADILVELKRTSASSASNLFTVVKSAFLALKHFPELVGHPASGLFAMLHSNVVFEGKRQASFAWMKCKVSPSETPTQDVILFSQISHDHIATYMAHRRKGSTCRKAHEAISKLGGIKKEFTRDH